MGQLTRVLPAAAIVLALFTFPVAAQEAADGDLKTPVEKLSYVIGMDVGASLKQLDTDIDLKAFMQAVERALNDQEPLLTPQETTEIKQAFMKERREEAAVKNKAAGEKNLAEGKAFLEENKTKEGVKTTESGLQYLVVKEGNGPKPKATDKVTVHYRGTVIDGTEFDSSYQRGEPATFPLNGVIPGWGEGLQLMPVGSTYKLFIPAELAYGERGAGPVIGPNATLIFEVELLEITDQ